ncbi:MAG: hypothetical protein WKF96_05075 [Solirubrobacteraceae bacterium]
MTTSQLRITRPASAAPLRALVLAARLPLLVICAAAAGLLTVAHPEWYRSTLAIALGINLIVLGMKWPRAAALATLLFLPFLALIRRVLIADAGFTSNDPLLLVGPIVALFLLYRLYIVEARRSHDRLFKLVAALLTVAVIQVFNPFATGGLLATAGGLLFVGVPLLWFFVGRELGDRTSVAFLLYGTIVVACLVGIYGLLQTQFGTIASWDQTWLDVNGYTALNVGDSGTGSQIRPFSTFSSNQEYSLFMAIGVTFLVALLLRRRFGAAVVLPLLLLALFLAGGRASVVTAGLAAVILAALVTRRWLPGLLVVTVGVLAAYAAAATFGDRLDRAAGLGGNAVIERNVSGLLNPLDPGKSTAITHYDFVLDGVAEGIRNPAGRGTGASSIATKLTDSEQRDSEIDLSNAFINFGIVGGVLYAAIIVLTFRATFARYIRHRDALSLAVVGMLVAVFGQWLNGGLYAIAPLLWFLVGWATRPDRPADGPRLGASSSSTPAELPQGGEGRSDQRGVHLAGHRS